MLRPRRVAAHSRPRDSFVSIGWLLVVPFLLLLGIDALISPFRGPSFSIASQDDRPRRSRDTHVGMPRLHQHAT